MIKMVSKMPFRAVLRRREALLGVALAPLAGAAWSQAAAPLPETVRTGLPGLSLAGRARLTYFGFRVYDAQLWVSPEFKRAKPTAANFVLDLTYLRALKGASIAERSLSEMRRGGALADEQAQRWLTLMKSMFPDVASGDRLLGVHRPGQPTRFVLQGSSGNLRELGTVRDEAFDQRFFDIWLGANTSQPALRDKILGQTP
jgi:hypothetical protein